LIDQIVQIDRDTLVAAAEIGRRAVQPRQCLPINIAGFR
jgi:hypothetical protein